MPMITIELPDDVYEALVRLAKSRGQTVEECAVQIITEALDRYESTGSTGPAGAGPTQPGKP